MNQLTAQQRKIVYVVVAFLLFVPIFLLGAPATKAAAIGAPDQEVSGGQLAQMRTKYELGESSLGDVDPTSATMNLVLLGLRGVAASLLWQQADHERLTKNFNQMEQTVESIILLQPHFKGVWEYQAWNLAFNVSAECDAVADRFHWVKRGAKFLMRGTERNQRIPELSFETGRFFGQKIGRADEAASFRKFFKNDPDTETWGGGPDAQVNPDGKDNYEVARDWYFKANNTLEIPGVTQHKMDLALFLAYPYRSLMDYGVATEGEGVQVPEGQVDAAARDQAFQSWVAKLRGIWEQSSREWVNDYGSREIETAAGMWGNIILEYNEPKLREIAEREGVTYEQKQAAQEAYRRTTSYPYWKQRCDISMRPQTMQARFDLAEGKRLFREEQDFEGAKFHLERGMKALQEVIDQYNLADGSNSLLTDEQDLVTDGIKSLLIWRQVLQLLGQTEPEDYPLKRLWTDPALEGARQELTEKFLQWIG